jgi:hypothetical protein
MKSLNECILERDFILEGNLRENQLEQILKKIDAWNTVKHWMNYEKKNGGDPDDMDEDYFYTEMNMCDYCVSALNRYLDQDRDELTANGKIDLELLSSKLIEELSEDYSNGDLDDLNESEYFDDWEDYITIFETAWKAVTKQPFFVEL